MGKVPHVGGHEGGTRKGGGEERREKARGAAAGHRHDGDKATHERESPVIAFVKRRMQRSRGDFVTLKDAYVAFEKFRREENRDVPKKSDFTEEMLRVVGPYSPPSGPKKNYWKNWMLVDEEGILEDQGIEQDSG